MTVGHIEQRELSEELISRIDGRKVRVAVFTSFSFDPGFFELQILPCLFDMSFSQNERTRRCQVEDALRSVDEIAVYYDRSALSQTDKTPQLGFQRIDIRRKTGVFHPKLILLLVENRIQDEVDDAGAAEIDMSLIVGITSANLTRAGWWENVEIAHFEEIQSVRSARKKCSFRKDLLGLIQQIKRCAPEDEKHTAIDKIHDFLIEDVTTDAPVNAGADGKQYTRIFYGQDDLSTWLKEVKVSSYLWNLEIISPFFDKLGVRTLERLLDEVTPAETRLLFPKNDDGSGSVPEGFMKAVQNMPKDKAIKWSELPREMTQRGCHSEGRSTPRHVHAKLYRFWKGKYAVCLVGSVNLTAPAHSSYNSGNLEAAFLVDTSESGGNVWWLQPVEKTPQLGVLSDQCEDESESICIDLTLRYDWETKRAFYRYDGARRSELKIKDHTGKDLFVIQPVISGKWIDCGVDDSELVGKVLLSSSLLQVVDGENVWRILVREDGTSQRPSFESLLSPEDILRIWSAVVPEHKQQVLESRLDTAVEIASSLPPNDSTDAGGGDVTIFDRFAGVYHAFERFYKDVTIAITEDHIKEAETRLCGEKYDSLPVLLRKVTERPNADPVMNYVIFLCAKQIRDDIRSNHKEFFRKCGVGIEKLDEILKLLSTLKNVLLLELGDDGLKFIEWYEDMFLKRRQNDDQPV